MTEANSNDESRLDRLERLTKFLAEEHVKFNREYEKLLSKMEKLWGKQGPGEER